jgi:hypothetical protein
MLERGTDGDDTLQTRHLHLEASVVGDRHELGVARTPQNSVVCSLEPHHLEGEYLLVEVGRSAEADGQVDLTEGLDLLPQRNTVEQ